MTQYDLNGIDHIDIVEMPQNATLEQAIEIINTNFSSLSQIADINFVDFIKSQRYNNLCRRKIEVEYHTFLLFLTFSIVKFKQTQLQSNVFKYQQII